jgi:Arm DNA-binding domain
MKTTQTFSILIWANKTKETADGLPLFARVTVDGRRAEISLKRKVNPEHWDAKTASLSEKDENAKATNQFITHVKAELMKLYDQMQVLEEHISAETLKLRFTGGKEEVKTLLQVVDYHNNQMSKMIGIDEVPINLCEIPVPSK